MVNIKQAVECPAKMITNIKDNILLTETATSFLYYVNDSGTTNQTFSITWSNDTIHAFYVNDHFPGKSELVSRFHVILRRTFHSV